MTRPFGAWLRSSAKKLAAGIALSGLIASGASAQSPACARIAQQISGLALQGRDAGDPERAALLNRQIQAQRAEIQRISSTMRQIGCNQPNLQFGSDASPECLPLGQRLKALQQGVARLNQQNLQGDRAANAARRQTLLDTYDSYGCTDPIYDGDAASSPDFRTNTDTFFDPSVQSRRSGVTIGPPGGARGQNGLLPPLPENDDDPGSGVTIGGPLDTAPLAAPQAGFAGRQPVCVRLCDGFFFPIAGASNPAQAQDMCKAQCPQAEATLFLRAPNGEISDATDLGGQPYSSLPNALKYRTKSDEACTCRRADQSWGAALKPAEDQLEKRSDELVVTPKNQNDIVKGTLKVPGAAKTGTASKPATESAAPLPGTPRPNVRIIDTSKAKTP